MLADFYRSRYGCLPETLALFEKLGVRTRPNILGYEDEATKIVAIDSAVALVNPAIADNVEVYSIVLSEAWAREKPVIVSKVDKLSYKVKQYTNGVLVEPLAPEILAEVMLDLVYNHKLATMGEKGESTVFSWITIVQMSVELYEYVMSNGKDNQCLIVNKNN